MISEVYESVVDVLGTDRTRGFYATVRKENRYSCCCLDFETVPLLPWHWRRRREREREDEESSPRDRKGRGKTVTSAAGTPRKEGGRGTKFPPFFFCGGGRHGYSPSPPPPSPATGAPKTTLEGGRKEVERVAGSPSTISFFLLGLRLSLFIFAFPSPIIFWGFSFSLFLWRDSADTSSSIGFS